MKRKVSESKKPGLFFRILIYCVFGITVVFVFGRSHLILGTGLIIGRWALVFLGASLLYKVYLRRDLWHLRAFLVVSLAILLIEWTWNKSGEYAATTNDLRTKVSVMTYNVFFKNKSTGLILKRIYESDPDILVLQEVTPSWKLRLNKSIGNRYRYKNVIALHGTHGLGVYSKFPITPRELLRNSSRQPYAQVVDILVSQKTIRVINMHLASPAIAVENPDNFLTLYLQNYEERRQQIQKIQQIAQAEGDSAMPQLLVGDLNTTRYEPLYRDINFYWKDLFEQAGTGSGVTFPNSTKFGPVFRLDYILARGNIRATEVNVVQGGSSDHLAVVGLLEI